MTLSRIESKTEYRIMAKERCESGIDQQRGRVTKGGLVKPLQTYANPGGSRNERSGDFFGYPQGWRTVRKKMSEFKEFGVRTSPKSRFQGKTRRSSRSGKVDEVEWIKCLHWGRGSAFSTSGGFRHSGRLGEKGCTKMWLGSTGQIGRESSFGCLGGGERKRP